MKIVAHAKTNNMHIIKKTNKVIIRQLLDKKSKI